MLCLSRDELIEVTNRKYFTAQRKALNAMGIEFKIRPDGSLMVKRSDYDTPARPQTAKKRVEPNWGGLQNG